MADQVDCRCHMVSGFYIGNTCSHLCHNAGHFMPGRIGQPHGVYLPLLDMDIRNTQPAGHDLYQNLSRPRLWHRNPDQETVQSGLPYLGAGFLGENDGTGKGKDAGSGAVPGRFFKGTGGGTEAEPIRCHHCHIFPAPSDRWGEGRTDRKSAAPAAWGRMPLHRGCGIWNTRRDGALQRMDRPGMGRWGILFCSRRMDEIIPADDIRKVFILRRTAVLQKRNAFPERERRNQWRIKPYHRKIKWGSCP